jgi:aminoglycoside/choline kinase family phosphotransferase
LKRREQLEAWLREVTQGEAFELTPASEDASFRSYLRLSTTAGATKIVMDAPPPQEDCRPFVRLAELFGRAGVHVPAVLAADLERGFLLLSDFGHTTYLQAFTTHDATELYAAATTQVLRLQAASRPGELPDYDRTVLLREMQLFPDWYVNRHLGRTLDAAQQAVLAQTFDLLAANNLAQARVYVHRDFHSRNLMLCEPNPGVIDFQDALYGPISYDLVSLFRDAYIAWPEAQQLDWLIRYWERARADRLPVPADFADFYRDYEWMGVQRQLKVVGIFARLYHRDGKDRYLADIPRVYAYLHGACRRYRELAPLARLLDELAGQPAQAGYSF